MLEALLCFECAEARLDRCEVPPGQLAVLDRIRDPAPYRRLLPDPWGRPVVAPDMTKLEALRLQWVAFQAQVGDADRCWAMLPAGGRCGRRGDRDGVCETHRVQGCRLPGLGWRSDEPIGRIIVRPPLGGGAYDK